MVGNLVQHAPPQNPSVLPPVDARLTEIFRQTFRQQDLEVLPHSLIHAMPGFDSISMVAMLLAIEESYGVILRASVVRRLNTVADLVRALDGQGASTLDSSRPT